MPSGAAGPHGPSGSKLTSTLLLRGRFLHIAAAIITAITVLNISPHVAFAAGVSVRIDLSNQRMSVRVGGKPAYYWAVSTARPVARKGTSITLGSIR